ncbi:MAG: MFS transporter [Alphaproteobacteria bacterium]|nr:MFS transporter [Alphaproteobacteria bacterium]
MSVTSSPENSSPAEFKPLKIIATILFINIVAMTCFAALTPLMTIRLVAHGYSNFMMGLQAIMWAVGVLVLGRFYPTWTKYLGIMGSIFVGLVGSAAMVSLLPILPIGPLWLVESFISGALFGLFWTVSESWMSAVTPEKYRSRVNALYAMTIGVGYGCGPLLLGAMGNEGPWPFWIIALIVSAASLSFLWVYNQPSKIELHGRVGLWRTARHAGLILIIALVSGFTDAGTPSMFSVYILRSGFTDTDLLRMLFIFGLGRLILQMPVGMIADRVNRILVLCVASSLSAVTVLSLPWVLGTTWEIPILFLWGGLIDTFYVLGLSIMGSRFSGIRLVEMNTLFVMLYSFGTAIGAPTLGGVMDGFGAKFYPMAVAAVISVAVVAALLSTLSFFKQTRHE